MQSKLGAVATGCIILATGDFILMWMNDSRSKVVMFSLKGIERAMVTDVEKMIKLSVFLY